MKYKKEFNSVKKFISQGAWVTQSVKYLTLVFSSGRGLMRSNSKLASGLNGESA